jgi:hypothetical protein
VLVNGFKELTSLDAQSMFTTAFHVRTNKQVVAIGIRIRALSS